MAKIRGVKPDYWTDEDITELSISARLLFIGLWSYACDNGHLQDKPKQIKMRVLPADEVNCSELLRELADGDRIQRIDGWIVIPNFVKHQKPDKRYWQVCERPGCTKPDGNSQPETRGGLDVATTSPRVGSMLPPGEGDCEGEGEVKGSEGERPKSRKRKTSLPKDFAPNDTNRRLASERGVDLSSLEAKFKDWALANGATYIDWHLALNTWIRRERPDVSAAPTRHLPMAHEMEQPPDDLSPDEYRAWHQAQRERRRA